MKKAREYSGAGLFFVPVEHENNVNQCDEEAAKILELCQRLLAGETSWVDRKEADCRTPAQMRLVNALCGAAEVAEEQHPYGSKTPE